jgi:hypothetical protein
VECTSSGLQGHSIARRCGIVLDCAWSHVVRRGVPRMVRDEGCLMVGQSVFVEADGKRNSRSVAENSVV